MPPKLNLIQTIVVVGLVVLESRSFDYLLGSFPAGDLDGPARHRIAPLDEHR